MKHLPLAIALGFLSLPAGLLAIDTATTKVVSGDPPLQRNVSQGEAGDAKGMGWRWTASGGRRDMGQIFEVKTAFEARDLALQIAAGVDAQEYERPFRLSFFEVPEGISPQGEPFAVLEGTVPPKGQAPRKGSWVVISFDPIVFKAGRYAFLLEFLDEGTDGQAITLAVGDPASAALPGFLRTPEEGYKKGFPLYFILSSGQKAAAAAPVPAPAERRTLVVDQKTGKPFASIAAAVNEVQPGDTIQLAKGSGPYREVLRISQSGLPEAPIIFDGNGEVITGFSPLEGFRDVDGQTLCTLPRPFPCVLTYQGERLVQDAATGQFTKWARLSDDGKSLILLPGTKTAGWEISVRDFVVQVLNVSHHVYRNIRASGSLNDGFNLHGTGTDLVFENIEGFQNLDEGFSAHDQIVCRIDGGQFWENDNGIGNVARSSMEASNIRCHSNLGWGLWLRECSADLKNVRVWDNGAAQICFDINSQTACAEVQYTDPARSGRPWISYNETRKIGTQPAYVQVGSATVTGQIPTSVSTEHITSR